MKRLSILLILLLTEVILAQPSVTVLEPLAGEFIPAGSPDTVQWSVNSPIQLDSAFIYFSSDSGVNWTKLGEVPATQDTFIWTAPKLTSLKCLIRVEVKDTAGNLGSDLSESTFQVYIPGDINLSSSLSLVDVMQMVNRILYGLGWPLPYSPAVFAYLADVNCSGGFTLGDVVFLAYHVFGKPGFETLCGRRGL